MIASNFERKFLILPVIARRESCLRRTNVHQIALSDVGKKDSGQASSRRGFQACDMSAERQADVKEYHGHD